MPGPPTNIAISNIGPRSVALQFKPGYDGKTSISRWIVEAQVNYTRVLGMLSQKEFFLNTEEHFQWSTFFYLSTNQVKKNKHGQSGGTHLALLLSEYEEIYSTLKLFWEIQYAVWQSNLTWLQRELASYSKITHTAPIPLISTSKATAKTNN